MRIAHQLRNLIPGDAERKVRRSHAVEMVLLQNPSVDEIANAINADNGDDGEKAIDMDPIFGLRTLMCLFIVRAHFARHFGALCDTQYPDTWHAWHTSIFFFLGGMQMQMQYGARRCRQNGC